MTYTIDVNYVFRGQIKVEAENEREAMDKFNHCRLSLAEGFVTPFEDSEVSPNIPVEATTHPISIVEDGVLEEIE